MEVEDGSRSIEAASRGIVWLASYPRSGNTWLRIFLANLYGVINTIPFDQTDIDQRLDQLARFRFADNDARPYAQFLGRPAIEASVEEIMAARHQVLRWVVDNVPGLVLLKTHNANAEMFGHAFVPADLTVGAIYVVRNPLDVAVSLAQFLGTSQDEAIDEMGTPGFATATTETSVCEVRGSWSENVNTWATSTRSTLLVVRYEDLVDLPAQTFGIIARHMRIPYKQNQLAQAIELSSFSRLRASEESVGFRERPASAKRFFNAGQADQWRNVLTEAQVARIRADHGEEMARFGYL
jgi:hypothetical protein